MNDKPEKFMFDLNDFSNQKPVNAEDEEKSFSEDELNAAREESFKLGIHDATQKIRNEHEERTIQTLEALTQHLVTLLTAENRRETEKNLATARLTLSIVKKLMPGLAKKYSDDEIISLVRQSLNDRTDEPRLVVSVHDSMLDTLRDKIDTITASQAFQGQVVIIADEHLAQNNCRIEWADGGIEKDFNSLYAAIEKAFQSVLNRIDMPAMDKTPQDHADQPETDHQDTLKGE